MSKFILFDVGANTGGDSLNITKADPEVEAWAFEPVPSLYQYLDIARQQGFTHHYGWTPEEPGESYADRYHLYPLAMSDYDGESEFYVAGGIEGDFSNGASSLFPFAENLDKTWPGRRDFQTVDKIKVQVSRFDTWYKNSNLNLDRIDFFHCDTQGADLRVLKGMGDFVQLIKEGVVECPRDEQAKLYVESHTQEEIEDFLNDNGFIITRIEGNDPWANERNLYFVKK